MTLKATTTTALWGLCAIATGCTIIQDDADVAANALGLERSASDFADESAAPEQAGAASSAGGEGGGSAFAGDGGRGSHDDGLGGTSGFGGRSSSGGTDANSGGYGGGWTGSGGTASGGTASGGTASGGTASGGTGGSSGSGSSGGDGTAGGIGATGGTAATGGTGATSGGGGSASASAGSPSGGSASGGSAHGGSAHGGSPSGGSPSGGSASGGSASGGSASGGRGGGGGGGAKKIAVTIEFDLVTVNTNAAGNVRTAEPKGKGPYQTKNGMAAKEFWKLGMGFVNNFTSGPLLANDFTRRYFGSVAAASGSILINRTNFAFDATGAAVAPAPKGKDITEINIELAKPNDYEITRADGGQAFTCVIAPNKDSAKCTGGKIPFVNGEFPAAGKSGDFLWSIISPEGPQPKFPNWIGVPPKIPPEGDFKSVIYIGQSK